MRREDGEPAWLESTATAVCDETGRVQEVHCATRDVSPRHLAEDGRRASEALNETLFHALEEGVLVFAADGSIVAMNPSAERTVGSVAGARERAFPAAQMWDEQGEALAPQQLPWARVRATGEPQLGVVLAQEGARGGRIWLRINAVPLSGDAGERVLVSWAEITEIREAEERARFQADHDPLTGLPNRALLNRRLEAALAAARENQADVGLLFLDLDGFKAINDTVGHHGGDDLLCAVASRLARALRGGGDTAVRFSGDEFVVLVPEVEGGDGAGALADRLLEVLREPLQIGSTEHVVHASIGVAIAPKGDGEPEALLQQADAAMYQVKQAGGHGRRLYEPEMSRRSAQRRSTETALSHAIANDELELCYQPIWSLRRSRLDGFEALVRWRHPQRGLLMPTDFIPLAEQTGLSVNIGEWVLGVVCRQLRRWQTIEGTGKLSVNVNICARSLADFALPGRIADLLAEHELPPSRLGLEVTETMLMQQHEPARQTLTELHELGVRLSLDDFGTGYSSLSHLKDLPLDVLKIDRSFVAAPFDGTRQHAILGAIVTMAHSLGLEVVAEGVETEAQLTMLRRSECDFVQGFLLARPAKPEDVTSMLCDSRRLTSLPTRRWRRTERSRQSDDADQLAAGRET
jgi:diguanylate cyclase (GGDEF)-like protein